MTRHCTNTDLGSFVISRRHETYLFVQRRGTGGGQCFNNICTSLYRLDWMRMAAICLTNYSRVPFLFVAAPLARRTKSDDNGPLDELKSTFCKDCCDVSRTFSFQIKYKFTILAQHLRHRHCPTNRAFEMAFIPTHTNTHTEDQHDSLGF